MTRPIRILFLIDQLGIGGTERQLIELMRRLDPGKFELFLGCLAGAASGIQDFLPGDVKVKTLLLDIGSTYSLAALAGVSRLIRFIRSESIDVVQCYFPKAKVMGCIAGKLAGAKTVSCMRDLGLNISFANMLPLMLANFCTDRFLVNSFGVKDYLISKQRVRQALVDVVMNGVDVEKYRPATPAEKAEQKLKLGIEPSAVVIGVVANLRLVKGLENLIRVVPSVCQVREKTHFVIVGEGPLEDGLRRQAAALGVTEKITFAKGCMEARPYLQAFDIGVLCSLSEGFSNSILEYMAVGLPVVATCVGGNKEQVNDGVTGLLVPPGDSRALAGALVTLLKEDKLRETMAENARRYCLQQFAMDTMIERMGNYYRRLCAS
nr:glycosyltransferase [Nitrospirota bacterium]